MHMPTGLIKHRGASVLAALILVAVLGAIFIILQYVRASGTFAYEPAALMAAAAPTQPQPQAQLQGVNAVGCIRKVSSNPDEIGKPESPADLTKDSCPCQQPQTSADGVKQEMCLPGCTYAVTVAADGTVNIQTSGNSTVVTGGASAKGQIKVNPPMGSPKSYDCLPGNMSSMSGSAPDSSGTQAQGGDAGAGGMPKLPSGGASADSGSNTLAGAMNQACTTSTGLPGTLDSTGSCNATTLDSCSAGQQLDSTTGKCVTSGTGCLTGYVQIADGSCQPQTCTTSGGLPGTTDSSGNCNASTVGNCAAGQQYDSTSGKCVTSGPACTTGYVQLADGSCQPQNCTTSSGVPGTLDSSGTCTAAALDCPTGQQIVNGTCQTVANTCPAGQVIVSGMCQSPSCTASNGSPGVRDASGNCIASTLNCPTGQQVINGACQSVITFPQTTCTGTLVNGICTQKAATTCTPSITNLWNCSGGTTSGGLGSAGNLLTSFLTGVAQGVNQSLALQRYQQALNAAQQQAASTYAPYGNGSDGLACPQPQTQPDSSLCTVGTWQQQYQSNGCPTTWQCVSSSSTSQSATQPSATLSCQPTSGDVGTTVSISYSCGNATGSSGTGFATNSQLSGSASAVLASPSAGVTSASYTLTCTNQTLTASAQCAVGISDPSIVLVANPATVPSGGATAVGWVTSGMQSCTISSPDSASFTAANAGNLSINGIATTSPLTSAMRVVLNCTTVNGGMKSATALITIGSASALNSPISVSTASDGGMIARGGTDRITWSAPSAPEGSAMSLWLVDVGAQKSVGLIKGGLAVNGTMDWNIPAAGAACDSSSQIICASALTDNDTYAIQALLYTPSTAYVGDGAAPASPVAPVYGDSGMSGSFMLGVQ